MGESYRFETFTDGIDEGVQGVGSDPWGGIGFVGLRVPTLATPDFSHRYLFNLCGFELPEGCIATIHGWRELLTIGCVAFGGESAPNFVVEMEVQNPAFHFSDGNASFHLLMLEGLTTQGLVGATPAPIQPAVPSLAFRFVQSSALLYETGTTVSGSGFYVDLTAYNPPFKGRPQGKPVAHLKSMHDRRTLWNTPNAWHSLGLKVEGPGYVYLAASIAQTAGNDDLTNVAGGLAGVQGPALSEYQFQAGFKKDTSSETGVIYWRVGGALDVEIHNRSRPDKVTGI